MSMFSNLFHKKPQKNAAAGPISNPVTDAETKKVGEARTRAMNLLKDLVGDLNVANTARMEARDKERWAVAKAKAEGTTLEKTRYPIDDAVLKRYMMDISALHYGISRAGVTVLDTRELDEKISWLAEIMRDSIRNNLPETTKAAHEALCWGITVGRKDISEIDKSHEDDIVTKRLEIFDAHKADILAHKALENLQAELRKKKREREQKAEELRQVQEEMRKDVCESQDDVIALDVLEDALQADPNHQPYNEVEEKLMKLIQTREVPLFKDIKALDKFIDQEEKREMTYIQACSKAEAALLTLSQEYYPDLKGTLEKLADYVKHHVDEVNDAIDGMELALDYFDNVIDSIVETPIQKKHRINNIRIHMEEKQKRQEQKLAAEEHARAVAEKQAMQHAQEKHTEKHKTVIMN